MSDEVRQYARVLHDGKKAIECSCESCKQQAEQIGELKSKYFKVYRGSAEEIERLQAENQRLKDGYRQIKILNADKDADIKWLCEQALAAPPQKGQDNESPKVTA